MKHTRMIIACLLIIIISIACIISFGTGMVKAATNACGSWAVVKSPNITGTNYNFLNGVAAVSSTQVWAVGYAANNSTAYPLIENWNGTKWTITSGSSFPNGVSLQAVASVPGSNDAWAVGYYYPSNSGGSLPLIEYWNGTAWSIVAGPTPFNGQLNGVAAISANDVWAVGEYDSSNYYSYTLVEHWDGTSWSIISSPNGSISSGTSPDNILRAVWANSSGNVWAVGDYDNTDVNQEQPLMEHWNGTSWTVVSSPVVGTMNNFIQAVSGSSSKNVWAVGTTPTGTYTSSGIIEHWNGSYWSVVSAAVAGTADDFYGVVALSSTNAWVVGATAASSGGHGITLTEHWNGTSWAVVSSPDVGTGENEFQAVTRVPSTNHLWAVGYSSGYHSLTEYYC